MIVDFNKLADGLTIKADICIVGAGPAGLTLAREFAGMATQVILLESGGDTFDPAHESLNGGESVGLQYTGLTSGRRRQFAGAANIWGRVCVELDALDFTKRAWVAHSGWPLTKGDLAPFYRRARKTLELEANDYSAADWRAFGMQTAAFNPDKVLFTVAATTPLGDLADDFRPRLKAARNVTVMLHSTVTELHTNSAGTAIESLDVRSIDGKRASVSAKIVVLCCGGIENARLLLLSRRAQRNGLGNGNDLVGRYLADHPRSLSAAITPSPGVTLQSMFRSLRRGGASVRPRLGLSPRIQFEAGVLNCMAQVHFDFTADSAFAAVLGLREAVRYRRKPANVLPALRSIARDPLQVATMAFDRYARRRHPADGAVQLRLECMSEQAPNPLSRVTLARNRDRFGLPQPCIDWRTDDIERRTIAQMTGSVAREFERLELGSVTPESWLTDSHAWQHQLIDGFHHLGTTRMAADPRAGVVDADCRVHGVAGLFIAGSSVFPAAGHANSTLTIVALAIRLADHLKTGKSIPPTPSTRERSTVDRATPSPTELLVCPPGAVASPPLVSALDSERRDVGKAKWQRRTSGGSL